MVSGPVASLGMDLRGGVLGIVFVGLRRPLHPRRDLACVARGPLDRGVRAYRTWSEVPFPLLRPGLGGAVCVLWSCIGRWCQ